MIPAMETVSALTAKDACICVRTTTISGSHEAAFTSVPGELTAAITLLRVKDRTIAVWRKHIGTHGGAVRRFAERNGAHATGPPCQHDVMDDYMWVLKDSERDLMRELEPKRLAALDEDDLLNLHKRVRRARNKHVKNYRRGAARSVIDQASRGSAARRAPRPATAPRRSKKHSPSCRNVSRSSLTRRRNGSGPSGWRVRARVAEPDQPRPAPAAARSTALGEHPDTSKPPAESSAMPRRSLKVRAAKPSATPADAP